MGYLLDTNILSELRKGPKADPQVIEWAQRVRHQRQTISVRSLGEIRKGIAIIGRRDSVQATALDTWLQELSRVYASDILPVCSRVAEEWGYLNAKRNLPVIDGLLAATAIVHGLQIATRNVKDFEGMGLRLENPFAH